VNLLVAKDYVMAPSSISAVPTAEDYRELGDRVGHHGTMPREPEEGRFFTQVLVLRRTDSETRAYEPTVLLWSSSGGYVNAFWFDKSKLSDVLEILRGCDGLSTADLVQYRSHEVTRVGAHSFLEGRMTLRELIRRRGVII
jgi:hypothetical protein